MELLRAKVARIHSYGITVDDTQLAIILLANVELAAREDYGREFHPAIQAIQCSTPTTTPILPPASRPSLLNVQALTAYKNSTKHPPVTQAAHTPYRTKSPTSPNSSRNKPTGTPPTSTNPQLLCSQTATHPPMPATAVEATTPHPHQRDRAVAQNPATTHVRTTGTTPARIAKSSNSTASIPTFHTTTAFGTRSTTVTAPGAYATRWS